MARRLVYSHLSLIDIAQMRRWLSQLGSGSRAKQRAQKIARAIRELQRDPMQWPEGELFGTRQRVVEDYTIIYVVDPRGDGKDPFGDVCILRLYGPGQDRS
jgi:plasmid stabilization system protein ParE